MDPGRTAFWANGFEGEKFWGERTDIRRFHPGPPQAGLSICKFQGQVTAPVANVTGERGNVEINNSPQTGIETLHIYLLMF